MPTFNIEDAGQVEIHVQSLIDGSADRALQSTAQRIISHIQNDIIPELNPQPVDRGLYRAGWRSKRLGDLKASIANKVPHAPIIEWGARAANIKVGRVMIDALEKWVVRKGIASKEEARGIAWAVATNMKKHGIFNHGEGFHVLGKALKKFAEYFREEYDREMSRG